MSPKTTKDLKKELDYKISVLERKERNMKIEMEKNNKKFLEAVGE